MSPTTSGGRRLIRMAVRTDHDDQPWPPVAGSGGDSFDRPRAGRSEVTGGGWMAGFTASTCDTDVARSNPPCASPASGARGGLPTTSPRVARGTDRSIQRSPLAGPDANEGPAGSARPSELRSAPGGNRTPNLLIRSQTLYPIELRALSEDRAYRSGSALTTSVPGETTVPVSAGRACGCTRARRPNPGCRGGARPGRSARRGWPGGGGSRHPRPPTSGPRTGRRRSSRCRC